MRKKNLSIKKWSNVPSSVMYGTNNNPDEGIGRKIEIYDERTNSFKQTPIKGIHADNYGEESFP